MKSSSNSHNLHYPTIFVSSTVLAGILSGCSNQVNNTLFQGNKDTVNTLECDGHSAQITLDSKGKVSNSCGDKTLAAALSANKKIDTTLCQTHHSSEFHSGSIACTIFQNDERGKDKRVISYLKAAGNINESPEIPYTSSSSLRDTLGKEKNKHTPYDVSRSIFVGLRAERITQEKNTEGKTLQTAYQFGTGAVASDRDGFYLDSSGNSLVGSLGWTQALRNKNGGVDWRKSFNIQAVTDTETINSSESSPGVKASFKLDY